MNFTTTLRGFHNDPAIKERYVLRARNHRLADELAQGVYYDASGPKLRACAVGCTVHGSDHGAYERELGVPRLLARVEDMLFERMRFEDAKEWPEKFLQAIPVGADLSMVWPRFAVWMLSDPTSGVLRFAKHDDVKKAIADVVELYEMLIAGAGIDDAAWSRVQRQAWAARDAARRRRREAAVVVAAVAAVAAEAAEAAEVAVAVAVAVAAEDYWSPRHEEARRAYALLASSKLLEILAESPVPVAA